MTSIEELQLLDTFSSHLLHIMGIQKVLQNIKNDRQ